jgi:phosphinothricin acetyltransferase
MPDADTSDLALRDSEPADIPAITAIYRHAVLHGRASFELVPPEEPEMGARRAALVAAGFPHIVAILGGELAGYAYAGPWRPGPAYANTVENSVYVRHDRHGRGVGRALLARLIAEAERRGFRQMIAVIGDSENRSSIELHRKLGFAPVGVLRSVGWKHERWLDSVLMQRPLGGGDSSPPDR